MKEVPVAKRVPQFFLQYSLTKARPQTACVGRTLRSLDRVAPLHAEDQVTRSFLFAEFKTGVCRRARCRHAVDEMTRRHLASSRARQARRKRASRECDAMTSTSRRFLYAA